MSTIENPLSLLSFDSPSSVTPLPIVPSYATANRIPVPIVNGIASSFKSPNLDVSHHLSMHSTGVTPPPSYGESHMYSRSPGWSAHSKVYRASKLTIHNQFQILNLFCPKVLIGKKSFSYSSSSLWFCRSYMLLCYCVKIPRDVISHHYGGQVVPKTSREIPRGGLWSLKVYIMSNNLEF
jgi:hypothetical protein